MLRLCAARIIVGRKGRVLSKRASGWCGDLLCHAPVVGNGLWVDGFDAAELRRFQDLTSEFTMCNKEDPATSLPYVPFAHKACEHQHVWLDPPARGLHTALSHYVACKAKAPEDTSACILVPRYEGGSAWRRHLLGMRLLHEYPAGTPLKSLPPSTPDATPVPAVSYPHPMQVWYDPPRCAEPVTGWPGVVTSAWCPADDARRNKKPGLVLNSVQAIGGLTMSVLAALGNRPAKILLDSGASTCFVAAPFAALLSAPVFPMTSRTVQTAGGAVLAVGKCSPRLQLQGHASSPSFAVMPTLPGGYDAILGEDWLREHHVHMMYGQHNMCTVRAKKGRVCVLGDMGHAPQESMEVEPYENVTPPLLSALQYVSAVRSSSRSFAVLLTAVKDTSPAETLPEGIQKVLAEYKDVFEELPVGLPPDRGAPHTIPLLPNSEPPHKRMYRLSPKEREEVDRQVTTLLEKGWIVPSTSPYGAPILFTTKKDGTLRMCVDYRALNKQTIKNRFPLPRIDDLLESMHGAVCFSALDLQQGYHQQRITDEDVPKTAFLTHNGLYEYLVLPFGLSNAPSSWSAMIAKVLAGLPFAFVYLDDICIASCSPEEHESHLAQVLQRLREHKLYAKMSKCVFARASVKYLGHIISAEGISPDPAKIDVVQKWPVPTGVEQLRSFLGLATYFKKFVPRFAELAHALHVLLRKDCPWRWTCAQQASFDAIKLALTSPPVLARPDFTPDAPGFEIHADASIIALGAILMQVGRVIAYCSRKLSPAECNYTTGEQEFLAVVHALREWRCYVEGKDVLIVTDHNPLVYLPTQPILSRRQARWMQFLALFDLSWKYRPGVNNPADALSRLACLLGPDVGLLMVMQLRPRVLAKTPTPTAAAAPLRPRVKPEARKVLAPARTRELMSLGPILKKCKLGYETDPWFTVPANVALLSKGAAGLWHRDGKTVVPDVETLRLDLLQEVHDTPYGGHLGMQHTYDHLHRLFWWPTMREDVATHVSSCHSCQRNKVSRQCPAGLLQSMPVPEAPWQSVGLDFITQLPETTSGNTQIVVFVDRLTKMCHLAALPTSATALDVAYTFMDKVFKLHGLPRTLVSDRDSKFTSLVWREIMRLLGTKLLLSTAYHPQTDGQTERMNQVLQEMLRHWVNPQQNNWDTLLATAEFAINNSFSEAVRNTPFRLNYGHDPLTPLSIAAETHVPCAQDFAEHMRKCLSDAKTALIVAQDRQKQAYDAGRRPQTFQVGQDVLLRTINLNWKTAVAQKLMPKYVGPFRVVERVGELAYKLQLPPSMRVHPVFHTCLLKPWKRSDRHQPPPLPIPVAGEPEYEVEHVLAHRGAGARRSYLVRWRGYDAEHDTWEPVSHLKHAAAKIAEYVAATQT